MKKITLLFALLCFSLGFSQTFVGTGTPVDTQGPGGGTAATCGTTNELNLTVTVTGIGILGTTNILDQVDIDITHSWSGDVNVTLIAPDGTTEVDLTSGNGASGDDYTGTQFRDDAATSITAGSAPFTGPHQPEQALSTFDGVDADGTWTLKFCDSAGGDVGTFNSWSISFAPAPTCAAPSDLAVDTVTDTNATVSWVNDATTTEVSFEFGISGFTPGTGTFVAAGGGIATAGPDGANAGDILAAETDYDFYVISDCGAGGLSNWAGPLSFTTLCPATLTGPYLADFGTIAPNCWSEGNNTDISAGPNGEASGWANDDFLNTPGVEAAKFNLFNTGDKDWLVSPTFDFSSGGNGLAFDVGVTAWNSTDTETPNAMGSDDEVQVLYSIDGGATWINLETFNLANAPSNLGESRIYDLSTVTSTTVNFAFWASEGIVNDDEDIDFFVANFNVDSYSNLSVDDYDSQIAITYFPNPVKNTLTINAQNTIQHVSMYNMLGQVVLSSYPNSIDSELDMSTLQSGTYFVKVTIANVTNTIRIIKQ